MTLALGTYHVTIKMHVRFPRWWAELAILVSRAADVDFPLPGIPICPMKGDSQCLQVSATRFHTSATSRGLLQLDDSFNLICSAILGSHETRAMSFEKQFMRLKNAAQVDGEINLIRPPRGEIFVIRDGHPDGEAKFRHP